MGRTRDEISKMRNVHEMFVGYKGGNRASAKHKQRRDNNVKMDPKVIGLRLCDVRHVSGHKAFYKIRTILDHMANYLLLKQESAPKDQLVSCLAYYKFEFCEKLN
jgi:hypothetical protein